MNSFVYTGKHRVASLDLPTRSVTVERDVPFEVDDDEAALLSNTPGYEPKKATKKAASTKPEGDED